LAGAVTAAALRRARDAAAHGADRRATSLYVARLESEAFEQERRHQRELAAQQAAVLATVESMSQGFVTFGRHARLTLANSRCAEIVGLPLESLRPGVTLPELIAAARGAQRLGAAHALERLVPLVIRREPAAFLHELGRTRRVMVVHRPLQDGGWLATFEDATAQEAMERRLARLAHTDALTGLRNLAWLREHLAGLLAAAETSGAAAALLHVNLDRFRSVNEALGQAVGDALLRGAARRIEDTVRRGRGGDVVRLGADEFAVVLRATTSGVAGDPGLDAAGLAERIVAALGKPFEVEGYRVVTGASIGIAMFPAQGRSADELLTRAALAMRRAKGGSRGGHAFYAPEMTAQAGARRLLELELRLALTEGSGRAFELRCEPVLDVVSRRVVGVEAQLRWQHSVHGLVPHDILAALAADLGLAAPLGRMLPRRAVAALAAWPDTLRVGIGFSVAQLLEPGLVERLDSMLAEVGIAPQRLEILVAEPELRQAPHLVLDTLHRLRGLGLRVTLDEFGASDASPWSLRAFPFDRVRLTRALVRELGGRNHGFGIMRALMALARQHGIPATAQGVETEEQLALLAAERCAQAQGPLFAAAVPAESVPALLQCLGAAAPVANDLRLVDCPVETPSEARAS
ncbi:putative bifunctional diguanylate cyclase/phosphodiesterase, partial [Falsiroseomonas oryziterrae]|uniref:putative bifunctional diguanylate cyclase/phosphodiesterase n=1 Tax=Falsiroseomonas oryziterrae TaxID=2911368 RepID=UPI001F3433A8